MENNNNLISENNNNLRKLEKYQPTNNGLISEQNSKETPNMYNFTFETNNHPLKKETFETFKEGNYKLSEHDFLSQHSKPPKPIRSVFEEEYPQYHKGTDIFMDTKEPTIEKQKRTPIQKSINAPKLKESKLKKATKIIAKATIVAAILAGLIAGASYAKGRIETHIKTEGIKVEIMDELSQKLSKMGIDSDNIDQHIEALDKDFIKDNLFGFYLLTDNNYETMKKIANKINYSSFGDYVEDLGYVEIDRDESGIPIASWASYPQYENAMEAQALKEKEQKENTEQQTFEEFQNYSKGAR